jgi:hypothetical protein
MREINSGFNPSFCPTFWFILQQMFSMIPGGKIEDITAGIIAKRQQDCCTTIRNLLCPGFTTSTTVKTDFEGKAIVKKSILSS